MTTNASCPLPGSGATDGFAGLPGASVLTSVTMMVRSILALFDSGSDAVNATEYVLAAS